MTATTTLATRLAEVRARIAQACERAGRDPSEVLLVGVSKTQPPDAVREAVAAGLLDLGENRAQDVLEQAAAATAAGLAPRWHFIGHLQRNKVARASGRFALLHGVDSAELAGLLSSRAAQAGARQAVLLEVNLGEAQKQGVAPGDLARLLDDLAGLPGLDVRGFMGMAPWGATEDQARRLFGSLRELAERERARTGLALPELSMGMSGDYEAAILEGATIVRVGSAIFAP